MKVVLSIELDLPVECEKMSKEELRMILYEDYVHYVTLSHSVDAMNWCSRGKIGSDSEDNTAKIIYKHHNTWMDITDNVKWKFKMVNTQQVNATDGNRS